MTIQVSGKAATATAVASSLFLAKQAFNVINKEKEDFSPSLLAICLMANCIAAFLHSSYCKVDKRLGILQATRPAIEHSKPTVDYASRMLPTGKFEIQETSKEEILRIIPKSFEEEQTSNPFTGAARYNLMENGEFLPFEIEGRKYQYNKKEGITIPKEDLLIILDEQTSMVKTQKLKQKKIRPNLMQENTQIYLISNS